MPARAGSALKAFIRFRTETLHCGSQAQPQLVRQDCSWVGLEDWMQLDLHCSKHWEARAHETSRIVARPTRFLFIY